MPMDEQEVYRARRRKRRKQQRMVTIFGFLLLSTGLAWFFESQATTTVILTRYADIPGNPAANPGLSLAGEQRARELARVLRDVDVVAGVDVIFTPADLRSSQTSVPLASPTNIPVRTIDDPTDIEGLVKGILRDYKGKIVLIITEPEIIQPLIDEMHGSKKLPPIGTAEYDNLYIVTIPWFGKVKTLRLRYGDPYSSIAQVN